VDEGAALADAEGAAADADGEAEAATDGVTVAMPDDAGDGDEAAGPAVQAEARTITARKRFMRQIIAGP